MNKSNEIIQITSSVLERYRSSIPRKAFAEAMERVIESVLGPGECPAKSDCPGLVMHGCGAYGTADLRCLSTVPAGTWRLFLL